MRAVLVFLFPGANIFSGDDSAPYRTRPQIVFDLAGSARKWMQQLPGVGHHGLWTDDALAALDAFLDRI